jgi:triacylglycerol lipase
MAAISDLSFKEKSLAFAKLASIAYSDDIDEVTEEAKKLKIGITKVKFYDYDGAQAYQLMSKDDIIIACRGTQPSEFNDISADLRAIPVMAETVGRVHLGFKDEVDELWPMVKAGLLEIKKERLAWFCGHSLGAAMATIMASRCHADEEMPNVQELYTYGSPRVGNSKYVRSFSFPHHRWVNNNDIVTRVPLRIMGYRHHGEEHYMNSWGNVRNPTGWQRTKDRLRGMWWGLKKGQIDNFSDHSMVNYIENLERYNSGMEVAQV